MPHLPMPPGLAGRCLVSLALFCCFLLTSAAASAQAPSFMAFESGHVRPMAMSPDGTRLFVTNTPNNTLDVFRITDTGLSMYARVPVGLEPVAVAALSDTEVWVVNHLSDSVSVVRLDGLPRVSRTLLVGDEPRDIVFAGSPRRAFITTAHRGQHRVDASLQGVPGAGDPQLTTPSVPRADVWVFEPANLGSGVGGQPLRIMSFFTDTPRALATSPDGSKVYVAGFKTGNQTTVITEALVCDGFEGARPCTLGDVRSPGGNPGPGTNAAGNRAPEVGLIVKFNNATQAFEDELGRNWNDAVRFRLPDRDVFAVDANTLTQRSAFPHVGTVLFNMVTNPATGTLYVSNTEANNASRFTGAGTFAGQTLQGHLAETRITVISGSNVAPRHLNKHIDYAKLANNPAFDRTTKDHSLATPLGMAVTADGSTLFVAAFGSSRIGVFNTAELEADTFDPRQASAGYITVSGGGPSDVLLDEARGRMYVTTRFDNGLKVIDLASRTQVAAAALPNPEPAHIVEGRPFLYDAQRSSANGEASCSSCHMFGDMDDLAWDLGNPDDVITKSPLTRFLGSNLVIRLGRRVFGPDSPVNGSDRGEDFHPLKGPMATQTLRGMRNHGALHWRGDRATGTFGTDATDSTLSFKNFVGSFGALLGSDRLPSEAEMETFARFQLDVQLQPNPIRNLDNSLTPAQARGRAFYLGPRASDGVDLGGLTGALGGLTGSQVADMGIPGLSDLPGMRNLPILGSLPGFGGGIPGLPGGGGLPGIPGLPGGGGGLDFGSIIGGLLGGQQTSFTCQGCHRLDPARGFFGAGGEASFEALTQIQKIPQLRNMYAKVGMFGVPAIEGISTNELTTQQGDQIRGFGFEHDGAMDNLFRFFNAAVFAPNGNIGFPQQNTDGTRRDVVDYMMAFDSDLAPIVGQQITLNDGNTAAVGPRIDLLIQRAGTPFVSKELGGTTTECDLTARLVEAGLPQGYLFDPATRLFKAPDGTTRSDADLRALAATPGQEVTYTCVPPGSGRRIAYNQTVVVAGVSPGVGSDGSTVGTGGTDSEAGGGAMGLAALAAIFAALMAGASLQRPGQAGTARRDPR
jgi:YVTN family beta-propeller protein